MSIILSIDIGTSKIAAVAYDIIKNQTIAIETTANSSTVSGLAEDKHEQNAEQIYTLCLDLLRRLIHSGKFSPDAVKSISISGQMHGVLLVDRSLQPLTNLITWCDRRTTALTGVLDRTGWPVERTGCYLHPGYGGATLAFMAQHTAIPAGAHALTIADYVAARLCGVMATDASHAASWGIMDIQAKCWDEELIARLGIPPELLPEIRPDLSVLGTLRVALDLPANVVVHLPLGDNQASFIGTCGLTNEAVLLNLGTGGQISWPLTEFQFRPELETRPLPFGGYLQVGTSLCGGRAYAYLKDFFKTTLREFTGNGLTDTEIYAGMNRLAEHTDHELVVDTRFAGTRLKPEIHGQIAGIDIIDFNPAALTRGFIHGMVRELTSQVDPAAITQLKHVMVSGNAIRKNPLTRQFVSAELGLPCRNSVEQEEAATGAAIAVNFKFSY